MILRRWVLVFTFINGMGQVGVFQTAFILGVENVGKDFRVFCGIVIEFFCVAGEALTALAAWRLRDWRKMLLWVMTPSSVLLTAWPFLPESLRWQISNRKMREAQATADRIARWNGKDQIAIVDFKQERRTRSNNNDNGITQALKSGVFVSRNVVSQS